MHGRRVPESRTPDLVVVAPLGAPGARPRLEKMIRIAAAQGRRIEYWGWRRSADDDMGARLEGMVATRTLLGGGAHRGRWLRLLYPVWPLIVFWHVLRHGPRNVFALGLETALGVWAASLLRRVRYIFDDADRLVMLINAPGPIDALLRWLERRVSARSAAHILPALERYEYRTPAMRLIPNTPDDDLLAAAEAVPVERPDARLVVYVNGWLVEDRGIGWIRAVAERLGPSRSIRFILAGRIDNQESERLCALGTVDCLGKVSQPAAIAWYRAADLVATFYDPAQPINRYAASNKWGDAVFTATGIIMNEEVVTGRPLVEAGAALALRYGDVDALEAALVSLAEDPARLDALKRAAAAQRASFPPYREAMEAALDTLDPHGLHLER